MSDLSCRAVSATLPDALWQLLLAARAIARDSANVTREFGLALENSGQINRVDAAAENAILSRRAKATWQLHPAAQDIDASRALLELYLPLCDLHPSRAIAVAHLGQSVDGRIATESGASHYVNDTPNIVHLHRLRALCDAVLVGAETVRLDDPSLTTRHVPGENPIRVILDPSRRLKLTHKVFRDNAAPTWLICDETLLERTPENASPGVRLIGVPAPAGQLDLPALMSRLAAEGLRALFVEGGGRTVSAFLQHDLLDRLHVAVAPLIIGSGRPSFTLPPVKTLDEAKRPPARLVNMGCDVLFDFDLRNDRARTTT